MIELGVAESVGIGVGLGLIVCTCTCIICRIWRRNRYYSKVQRTLDAEEAAFQETLARSYGQDGVELDNEDRAKLDMLDSYMQGVDGDDADEETGADAVAPMPTRVEDVDKFMQQLAAAASGGANPPGGDDEGQAC